MGARWASWAGWSLMESRTIRAPGVRGSGESPLGLHVGHDVRGEVLHHCEAADLGGSSAQSVVLMLIVIALTVVQFRYIERKVQY